MTKAPMTHRERVLTTLAHREPDRVPLDLASNGNTSITVPAYQRLLRHLGFEGEAQPQLMVGASRMMGLAAVDEAVLQRFDIDVRGLTIGPADNFQYIEMPGDAYQDEWGVLRRRAPTLIYYELTKSPLAGEITLSDIARFPWPDPLDAGKTRGMREKALYLRRNTDYAIALRLPDICVHKSQYMRGFEQWYMDFILEPRLIEALLDAIVEVQLAEAEAALKEVGDLIDLAATADDVAGQRGPLISPQAYRRFIKPRHKRYMDMVHRLTPAKVFYHSCGSVYPLLDDLIEIGVDILNPVQVSAANMDTQRLKREYGDKLVFWGGVDTQRVMPMGSPADVRQEVRRRIQDLAPGGGYVLTAVHNIQPDVPPENICAMYDSALELGRYPLETQADGGGL